MIEEKESKKAQIQTNLRLSPKAMDALNVLTEKMELSKSDVVSLALKYFEAHYQNLVS